MQCPQPETLQQLLDESLPAEHQQAFKEHLDTCATCQKALERIAAGQPTRDRAAQNLNPATPVEEAALRGELDVQPSGGDRTQAEAQHAPLDDDLSFLQPTQKPGALGRLGDKYEILSVIGKGGFGIVLKAFDESLQRVVAIKVLAPQLAASATARQRFVREARAAAAVTHENVVHIYEVDDKAKIPFLAMQFVDGITLNDKIDRCGALRLEDILRIGIQIAEGLAAAHKQRLIHRDIKPGNILLENGVERVKITDFGLARSKDDATVTQSGTVAGTPMYMSPEQAQGEQVDQRSDLFSLGSVMYVMATGRQPFRAATTMGILKRVCDEEPMAVTQVNTALPGWLGDIIAKLHEKNPADRFQSAHEVADLLRDYLAHVQGPKSAAPPLFTADTLVAPKATPSISTTAQTEKIDPPPPARRRVSAGLIAALLGVPSVCVAVLVTVWLMKGNPPSDDRLKLDDAPAIPALDLGGFVTLFNGKNLDGWQVHPKFPGEWTVVEGVIIGRGLTSRSYLATQRGDYENFHLYLEARIPGVRDGGAVVFRNSLDTIQEPGSGETLARPMFWAPLRFDEGDNMPGRLNWNFGGKNLGSVAAPADLASVQKWFSLEIIARGPQVSTKINGKPAAESKVFTPVKAGHILLDRLGANTEMHYRKIAIKEMPPTAPAKVVEPSMIAQLLTSPDYEWAPPENLGPAVNRGKRNLGPFLTADEKTMIYNSDGKLYMARRKSVAEPFGEPQLLPESINDRAGENPTLSGDGLILVFPSSRGVQEPLWISTRKSIDDTFGTPVLLPEPVNTVTHSRSPVLAADGLTLFVTEMRLGGSGGGDIIQYTRKSRAEPFANPVSLPEPVNTAVYDTANWLSPDGLVILTTKMGVKFETRFHLRATLDAPFGPPQLLGPPFDFPAGRPWISPDGLRIYFHTRELPGKHGDLDLWMARRVRSAKGVPVP